MARSLSTCPCALKRAARVRSESASKCPRAQPPFLTTPLSVPRAGLPVLIVVLLFGISYFLVWLGPLKGISSRYIKMAGDEGGEGDL